MKYYKLSVDMEREGDIILHCKNCENIEMNIFTIGKKYNEATEITFYYDENEGGEWTDYLVNDKGWFIVSEELMHALQEVESNIQFIDISIFNLDGDIVKKQYFIANIIKVVDALCLEKSDYFETFIEGVGNIYTVSKYGIYEENTDGADVFKLDNWQQIPIFVSEKFKKKVEDYNLTGMSFREIAVE